MFMFRWLPLFLFEGDEGGGEGGGGEGSGGQEGGEGSGGSDAGKKPPWGDDKDFDPTKAWKLIEGLRADTAKAKADRDAAQAKIQQHERANESAQEKASREKAEAEKRATAAEGQALRLDVALDKAPEGMTIAQVRKLAKRLSGSTREELEADAAELFEDFDGNGGGGEDPPRRPKERLRSGAGGSEPEENDPKKLAEQVSRGW